MTYDLVVIGSGPAGYVCAIRAAQLGMKVAVVEKEKTFGGTCLNIGCIPSKALLYASEMFAEAGHGMAALGIVVDPPKLDLPGMMKHKDDTVTANVNGVAFLFKKNKIEPFIGAGRIAAPGQVEVKSADGKTTMLETKAIVIATGSDVARLPGVEIDEKVIISSTGALSLSKTPAKLLVVGAGVIGLELGSVWARLGADVTVVEYLDRILPGVDGEVAKQFQRILEKQGFKFHLGHKVASVAKTALGAKATIEPGQRADQGVWRREQRNTAVDLRHQHLLKIGRGKVFVQQDDLAIGPQLAGADGLAECIFSGLRAQDHELGLIGEARHCAEFHRGPDIANDAIRIVCHQRFERFANK